MYEVSTRNVAPYSSICYIQVVFPDGMQARASGVVVGPNDVLTALHVLYEDAHGGWATSVQIMPGADTRPWDEPYGAFTDVGTMVGRAPNWDLDGDGLLTDAESAGDLALIGMKSRIGDATGIVPVAQVPTSFNSVIVGYPAAGTGMMADGIFAQPSPFATVYDVNDGLGPGASGGPILATVDGKLEVAGVLSSGTSDNSLSTYAGLYGSDTWSWLQNALVANDYLIGGTPTVSFGHTGLSYLGTASADTWTGSVGWDAFEGNGANDTFSGGSGTDTAVFNGVRASYTVSVAANGTITVQDSVAGRDGTDTLTSVERLQFSDSGVAFDIGGNAGEAYRLYRAALDRVPDVGGMGYQMHALDSGLTLSQLANNFLHSPEFQAKYGTQDDGQFVTLLYQNVLHRAPDADGFAYHVNDLQHNGLSRADVLMQFSESPENQAQVIGQIQNGIVYTS